MVFSWIINGFKIKFSDEYIKNVILYCQYRIITCQDKLTCTGYNNTDRKQHHRNLLPFHGNKITELENLHFKTLLISMTGLVFWNLEGNYYFLYRQ